MAYRYRLYPSTAEELVLAQHCKHARFVWNLALEQANCWRPGRGASPGSAERMRQLADARQGSFLGEGSSSVQQQALRDFDQAMRNWWAGTHRRPTWRKKGRHEGFCVRDVRVERLSRRWARLQVPKLGWVRFRLSRPLPSGKMGMARVTLDRAGRWHVSFAGAQPPVSRESTGQAAGVDRGVTTTLVDSNGQHYRAPTSAKLYAKVDRLSRRLARQRRGSRRRTRTRRALGRVHARIADRRRDWVEKMSTRLVASNDVVVLERLRTKDMSARPVARPDPDHPGVFLPNGAAAKSGLNRRIARSAWGLLERRISDKATASGVAVVFVDPRNTSRTCAVCGHVAANNRESQAVFCCQACGHEAHADHNAATNILARGLHGLASAPGLGASSACISPPATEAARTTRTGTAA